VYDATLPLVEKVQLAAPGVETHCFYSHGMPTPVGAVYKTDDMSDESPQILYGDGDGTVHLAGLQVCEDWPNTTVLKFENVSHVGIMTASVSFEAIVSSIRALGTRGPQSDVLHSTVQHWRHPTPVNHAPHVVETPQSKAQFNVAQTPNSGVGSGVGGA